MFLSVEAAIAQLLENTKPVERTEKVGLFEALGRVLAEDIRAPFDNPPFDRSPLDGYTFNYEDTLGATPENPAVLTIIGEECAGDFFDGQVKQGEALRLMTGSAIPPGCNCVARQESVELDAEGRIHIPEPYKDHQNFCCKGEDVTEGTLMIKAGTRLMGTHIGVIASVGIPEVTVYARPRIVVASTGDELLMPGDTLKPGKIFNSNMFLLTCRLREMGFDPEIVGIVDDNADLAAEQVAQYRDKADLFITTGGVSVGKKDIMHGVIKLLPANRLFWGVALKPGAPLITYTYGPMLGIALSGNPFGAYATFELLVRPVLDKLAHRSDLTPRRGEGVLADSFGKKSMGRRFIRAIIDEDGTVHLPEKHDSGVIASVAGCNAMVDIPPGTGKLSAGTRVSVVLL